MNKPPYIDLTRGNDWAYIQTLNKQVGDHLFPARTDQSMFLKLYEEVSEIVKTPGNAGEIADVIIMLLDHAERHGIHAGHAVLTKLCTNLEREWVLDPTTNVAYHKEQT
jgi:hypothetical protein